MYQISFTLSYSNSEAHIVDISKSHEISNYQSDFYPIPKSLCFVNRKSLFHKCCVNIPYVTRFLRLAI